ncbi:MAG: hypothetical protein BWY66_00887 [bacterium ADurb.Bin374]|nr:MAG: hypothetical protein BWY66_00887 [bacterium ADurb.Bin374]
MSLQSKLQLSRKQLSVMCHEDPEAIRQMERLFSVGDRLEDDEWVDIDHPIIIRTVAPGQPTLAVLNGNITMPQWQVNDFHVCESQEFVHGWKEGTEVQWHIHLTTNGLDATDRYVKFTLEYGYVDVGGAWVFPALLTSPELLIPANTPDRTMFVFNLGSFTPLGFKIGAHAVARLMRIAAVGAAPTNNPFVAMLQMHIQVNTLGSRTVSAK